MLIQYRMGENLKLTAGDGLTVLDAAFRRCEGRIAGFIQNYQKRIIALTPEYYRELFGTEASENSYFVTLNGAEDQTLRDALLAVSGDLGFERADSFYEQYRAIAFMYNAVVLGVTVIAVLISFVILVNIAAIFVSKRKRELIIMRINGFSLRKARGLLMSEAFATTLAGLLLGALGGIPIAAVVVRFMETPDVMFVREFQPLAWVIAMLMEAGFAALIYGSAMRRVRDYQLSDLADAF
jgi:Predicted permease.